MNETGRKKVRILLGIWGEKYFDYLNTYSLPSWLATNNLPALARLVDLEIDFLTHSRDASQFMATPAYADLRAICPINFVTIDDLIGASMYSVTLTGAFGRGIIRHGEAMTDISFIFMNADFILSDGSLAHVGHLILRGEEAIMAPSYRAIDEVVAPELSAWIDEHDHKLDIPARSLVGLALDAPHPTAIAKFVTQQGCVTLRPNQLYWQVDENTVIGHYLLTFMLCIKPSQVVTHVNSYCDYGFIQHFSSLEKLHTITDSDDLFMLELQSHDFEHGLLRTGSNTETYIARASEDWATALHHANLKETLIFHRRDLPASIEAHVEKAHRFVEGVLSKLPAPRAYGGHPHWIGGLTNWRLNVASRAVPAEFDHPDNYDGLVTPSSLTRKMMSFFRRINRQLNADIPKVPIWHFYWADYRRFTRDVKAYGQRGKLLLVHDHEFKPDGVAKFARHGLHAVSRTTFGQAENLPELADITYAALLVHPDRVTETRKLVEVLRTKIPALRDISIMCPLYLGTYPQVSIPASMILRSVDDILPIGNSTSDLQLIGEPLHLAAQTLVLKLTLLTDKYPRRAVIGALLLTPILILMGLAGSAIAALRNPHRQGPSYASSLYIRVRYDHNSKETLAK